MFGVAGVWGLALSHRVAGPILHLKRHMDAISIDAPHSEEVKFRKNDFFMDLADSYNRHFKKLKSENIRHDVA